MTKKKNNSKETLNKYELIVHVLGNELDKPFTEGALVDLASLVCEYEDLEFEKIMNRVRVLNSMSVLYMANQMGFTKPENSSLGYVDAMEDKTLELFETISEFCDEYISSYQEHMESQQSQMMDMEGLQSMLANMVEDIPEA